MFRQSSVEVAHKSHVYLFTDVHAQTDVLFKATRSPLEDSQLNLLSGIFQPHSYIAVGRERALP